MKLWGGRFKKDLDKLMEDFNSSISFDIRLLKYDIVGSIAHAKGLYKAG
ncbi:MAG: argininosuccinate lyase, partial [Caldanaerobacter sp.]